MYARVTLLEVDTTRTSMEAALARYRQQALPEVRQQPGYQGVYVLTTPEGKGLIMTLWDSERAAQASAPTGFYADILARFMTLFRSPPGRESYEVALAEVPALAT